MCCHLLHSMAQCFETPSIPHAGRDCGQWGEGAWRDPYVSPASEEGCVCTDQWIFVKHFEPHRLKVDPDPATGWVLGRCMAGWSSLYWGGAGGYLPKVDSLARPPPSHARSTHEAGVCAMLRAPLPVWLPITQPTLFCNRTFPIPLQRGLWPRVDWACHVCECRAVVVVVEHRFYKSEWWITIVSVWLVRN